MKLRDLFGQETEFSHYPSLNVPLIMSIKENIYIETHVTECLLAVRKETSIPARRVRNRRCFSVNDQIRSFPAGE